MLHPVVIPTRERSQAGDPALSAVEGNLLFIACSMRTLHHERRGGVLRIARA